MEKEETKKKGGIPTPVKVLIVVAILCLLCCGATVIIGASIDWSQYSMMNLNNISNDSDDSDNNMDIGKNYSVGDEIEFDDYNVTVTEVDPDHESNSGIFSPDDGNKYVAFEVLVENTKSAGSVNYSAYNWKVTDSSGYTYSSTYLGSKTPSLSAGLIAPGKKARGWVTVEVPEDAKGLTAIYDSTASTNDDYAEISLGI